MNAELAAVFFSLVLGISVDWIQGETKLVRLQLNTISLVGLNWKITQALDAVNMWAALRRIKLRMFVRRHRNRCSFFETHFRAKFRCFNLLTVTTVSESSFRFMSIQNFLDFIEERAESDGGKWVTTRLAQDYFLAILNCHTRWYCVGENLKSRLLKRLPPKNLIHSSIRACDANLFLWSKPRQCFSLFCTYIFYHVKSQDIQRPTINKNVCECGTMKRVEMTLLTSSFPHMIP